MKVVINPAFENLTSFLYSVPERFYNEGVTIYKSRNEIKVFEIEGTQINIKQYKVPVFINRIIYTFFRLSKASRAYKYAVKLLSKGFDTPTPIAYIHQKKCGLIQQTYFISVHSPYPRNMYEFGKGTLSGREHIIESFARYTGHLHEAGIYHKDYSPGNILFEETSQGINFTLVDINRMKFGPVSIKKGCANFARLWGKEDLFRLIAREYAIIRKADEKECLDLILSYKERFWKKYKKKHPMPF